MAFNKPKTARKTIKKWSKVNYYWKDIIIDSTVDRGLFFFYRDKGELNMGCHTWIDMNDDILSWD